MKRGTAGRGTFWKRTSALAREPSRLLETVPNMGVLVYLVVGLSLGPESRRVTRVGRHLTARFSWQSDVATFKLRLVTDPWLSLTVIGETKCDRHLCPGRTQDSAAIVVSCSAMDIRLTNRLQTSALQSPR